MVQKLREECAAAVAEKESVTVQMLEIVKQGRVREVQDREALRLSCQHSFCIAVTLQL
jgi:hypothetical protein